MAEIFFESYFHRQDETEVLMSIIEGPIICQEGKGHAVVKIFLPDGRTIWGRYHNGDGRYPSISNSNGETIADRKALRPFVEALLAENKPFVTSTGEGAGICTLRRTIS